MPTHARIKKIETTFQIYQFWTRILGFPHFTEKCKIQHRLRESAKIGKREINLNTNSSHLPHPSHASGDIHEINTNPVLTSCDCFTKQELIKFNISQLTTDIRDLLKMTGRVL